MNLFNSYAPVALFLAVIGGIAVSFVRHRRSSISASRMQRMMVCCGVDEVAAKYADHLLKLDMVSVRHRCRHCPNTEKCDHWLEGQAVAGNDFCPNAQQFTVAAAQRARVTH